MKPLSHRFRISSLIILVILFIILVPILWAFSAGYRLDDALSIVRTGGIYINSTIPNTRVFIDDEFVEDNGIFLKNTLIQTLRPNKRYTIHVEKEGYFPWTKELGVFPNLVTEARVLMLKSEPTYRILTKNPGATAQATSTVTSTRPNVATTTTIALNPEYESLVELFSSDNEQFDIEIATTTMMQTPKGKIATTTILMERVLPEFILENSLVQDIESKIDIRELQKTIAWLDEGDVIVSWVGDEDLIPYFFCEADCKKLIGLSFNEDITRFDFYPGRNDVLLVLTELGLYAAEIDDRSGQNVQPVYLGKNLDFRVQDGSTIVIKEGDKFIEVVEI